jgi:hypothetical protein
VNKKIIVQFLWLSHPQRGCVVAMVMQWLVLVIFTSDWGSPTSKNTEYF